MQMESGLKRRGINRGRTFIDSFYSPGSTKSSSIPLKIIFPLLKFPAHTTKLLSFFYVSSFYFHSPSSLDFIFEIINSTEDPHNCPQSLRRQWAGERIQGVHEVPLSPGMRGSWPVIRDVGLERAGDSRGIRRYNLYSFLEDKCPGYSPICWRRTRAAATCCRLSSRAGRRAARRAASGR